MHTHASCNCAHTHHVRNLIRSPLAVCGSVGPLSSPLTALTALIYIAASPAARRLPGSVVTPAAASCGCGFIQTRVRGTASDSYRQTSSRSLICPPNQLQRPSGSCTVLIPAALPAAGLAATANQRQRLRSSNLLNPGPSGQAGHHLPVRSRFGYANWLHSAPQKNRYEHRPPGAGYPGRALAECQQRGSPLVPRAVTSPGALLLSCNTLLQRT